MKLTLDFILLHGALINAVVLLVYILVSREKTVLHCYFTAVVILIAFWVANDAADFWIGYFRADYPAVLLVFYYAAVSLLPVAFFLNSLVFFNGRLPGKPRWYLPLLVIPAVTVVMAALNPVYHGLEVNSALTTREMVYGWYFPVHLYYCYALFLGGAGLLLVSVIRSSRLFSLQGLLILIAGLIPFILDILGVSGIFGTTVYLSSAGFVFSVSLFWLAVFRLRFMQVLPVALKLIVNHISDGFIVLDSRNRLVDYNHSFRRIYGAGRPVRMTDDWVHILEQMGVSWSKLRPENGTEIISAGLIRMETPDGQAVFDVTVTPILDRGTWLGSVVLFQDVTRLQESLESLELKNRELDEQNRTITELNRQLKDLSERDGLTGVYNRRFFNEYYQLELERAIRRFSVSGDETGQDFAVAIFDIDNFKSINDSYGHLTGDAVIRGTAEMIRQNCYDRDVVCRYGGEEFAVIFTNARADQVPAVMEKILTAMKGARVRADESRGEISWTVSGGLAFFSMEFVKGHDVLKTADDRLLQAKAAGKNCFVTV